MARHQYLLAALLTSLSWGPVWAQGTSSPQDAPRTTRTLERIEALVSESQGLQRAINVARETATRLNGGLSVYRPASCMFAGINNNPCLISRGDDGFVFRFTGGVPGWEQDRLPATVETELKISRDGRSLVAVIYNGPVRAEANATSS